MALKLPYKATAPVAVGLLKGRVSVRFTVQVLGVVDPRK